MNRSTADLALAIVSYVTAHDGYITKTKLLKILYLFDVEFYRAHGRTFTQFQWKYFHLGPWTNEFEDVFEVLLSRGELLERVSARSEFDTKYLYSENRIDLGKPFESIKDELILKVILDTWGPSTTGEILDYVYFRTEPMEYGIRNETLDFSRIASVVPGIYKRSSSNMSAAEIKSLRAQFEKKMASRRTSATFQYKPPQYDEEFRVALEKMDTGEF